MRVTIGSIRICATGKKSHRFAPLGKTQVDGHVAVIVPAMSAYVFAPESR